MRTEVIAISSSQSIARAMDVLNKGGLVAFPTDTVYGVGALAFEERSIRRLYEAKTRNNELPLPILISGPEQLELVTINLTDVARILAHQFWPGPITLIVERHPRLPQDMSGTSTVGVRVPDHRFSQRLFAAVGPMAVTSANLSGHVSSITPEEVLADLNGRIDLLVDGGPTPGQVPSTVVDCTGETPLILRKGPITEDQILSVLPAKFP
ncbi:MAG: threonylcarbamoyl-AMP synthase [Chloroflexi bacterium RBG_16_48_8]|nr:MAG: threonylcarbamoyl-AMP synthase [Chloroflexi bacterium RBG_16_48_8]